MPVTLAVRRTGAQGRQPRTAVTVGGVACASNPEGRFHDHILLLQRAGIIRTIEPHPVFEIQPKFVNARGVKRRSKKYTADFKVTLADGSERVFDVKGTKRDKKTGRAEAYTPHRDYQLRIEAVERAHGIAIWTVYLDGRVWMDEDTKEALAWE